MGALKRKTVILVTHQVEFLHEADQILVSPQSWDLSSLCERLIGRAVLRDTCTWVECCLVMLQALDRLAHSQVLRDGAIVQSGNYAELLQAGTDFEALVDAHNESLEKVSSAEEHHDIQEGIEDRMYQFEQQLSVSPLNSFNQFENRVAPKPRTSASFEAQKRTDVAKLTIKETPEHRTLKKLSAGGSNRDVRAGSAKLIEAEERETGSVSKKVYWLYMTKAYGGLVVSILLLVQMLWQGLQIASDYWLANETKEGSVREDQAKRFITVYAWLAVLSGICTLARSLLVTFMGLTTAQQFYLSMVRAIFRAPMSFFDTTPSGRVLTRVNMNISACSSFWIILLLIPDMVVHAWYSVFDRPGLCGHPDSYAVRKRERHLVYVGWHRGSHVCRDLAHCCAHHTFGLHLLLVPGVLGLILQMCDDHSRLTFRSTPLLGPIVERAALIAGLLHSNFQRVDKGRCHHKSSYYSPLFRICCRL